jgi:hypothetical protein
VIAPLDCADATLQAGLISLQQVEVTDGDPPSLLVTLAPADAVTRAPWLLQAQGYALSGGVRRFPRVVGVDRAPPRADQLRLSLDWDGDFSTYTLALAGPGVDPFFAGRTLRFHLACEGAFDCRPHAPAGLPAAAAGVPIDYLAKDYASFRQALLDFLAARMPGWTEHSEADVGIAVLELLAATADTLSYVQDRVANEAFLGTARQRRSVQGHLALVGYELDEGAAAHAWLQLAVRPDAVLLPPGFQVAGVPQPAPDDPVFETLAPRLLHREQNSLGLWDWGRGTQETPCCLRAGTTSATLVGSAPSLRAGDWVLFADQDAGAVALSRLDADAEPVSRRPDDGYGPDLTAIRWSTATPLRHDYCVPRTVVRGNLVLATHGRSVTAERLALPVLGLAAAARQPRLRAALARGPLTWVDAQVLTLAGLPVPGPWAGRRSVPQISLTIDREPWTVLPTLLGSGPRDRVYRLEPDRDHLTLAFGRGETAEGRPGMGLPPPQGSDLEASYRYGGGAAGNVPAGSLNVPLDAGANWLISVTNPLPASGGRDPETPEHARLTAPASAAGRLVAVTTGDYQTAAQDFVDGRGQAVVGRTQAAFRWTGSWLTLTLAVEPASARELAAQPRAELLRFLDGRRLAGYDVQMVPAAYLALQLELRVCASPGLTSDDVRRAVELKVTAFFGPDRFSFGDPVYISRLYEAVMSVPGVASTVILTLAPLHSADPARDTAASLGRGHLVVAPDLVARLDNDPDFPEHGRLTVHVGGTP